MPSEPNVLPVSPAPGFATRFTPAVPGPHLNVAHNTPAARQPQALTGSSSTVQSFSKILSDIGALPSDPDVENAPSECNPPLTGRAFRYQRRDAFRAARTKLAGMFDPTDTLSTFDPTEPLIESPAQNSLPSRLTFPYTPSRELHTQHVAVTFPHMTHAPTATARPPFSAGIRLSLRDFSPLVPARALCSMSSPSPLRSGAASAAEPSPTGIQERSIAQEPAAPTAASADTSPVVLRTVSHSGAIRSRGLCPDAPVPSRTLTPGPSGPPTHLAHLTAVWHTLSAVTQAELWGVSPAQVAQGLELARFLELALADEEHQCALDPLLQRADFLSCSGTAARRDQEAHDSSAAAARRTAEMHEGKAREFQTRAQLVTAQQQTIDEDIATLNRKYAARVANIKGEPFGSPSSKSPRTSSPPAVFIAPPAPLRQQNSVLAPSTTATSVAPRTLPQHTAAAVTFSAAPVAAPTAAPVAASAPSCPLHRSGSKTRPSRHQPLRPLSLPVHCRSALLPRLPSPPLPWPPPPRPCRHPPPPHHGRPWPHDPDASPAPPRPLPPRPPTTSTSISECQD